MQTTDYLTTVATMVDDGYTQTLGKMAAALSSFQRMSSRMGAKQPQIISGQVVGSPRQLQQVSAAANQAHINANLAARGIRQLGASATVAQNPFMFLSDRLQSVSMVMGVNTHAVWGLAQGLTALASGPIGAATVAAALLVRGFTMWLSVSMKLIHTLGMLAVRIGAVAAGMAALAGGLLMKGIIGSTMLYEKLSARLLTVAGSAKRAGEMMKWALDFAKTTPFELNQVIDAMTTMSIYGLKPMAGQLRIIGDFATAMGEDVQRAVLAVARAISGEWIPLKETFGLSKDMILQVAPGSIDKMGKVVDQAKMLAGLFQIMKQRGEGGMARMMETIEGKWSNVKDAAFQFFTAIGLATVAGQSSPLGKFFKWLQETIDKITDLIGKGAMDNLLRFINTGLTFIPSLLGDASTAAERLAGWLNKTFETKKVIDFIKAVRGLVVSLTYIGAWIAGIFIDPIIAAVKLLAWVLDTKLAKALKINIPPELKATLDKIPLLAGTLTAMKTGMFAAGSLDKLIAHFEKNAGMKVATHDPLNKIDTNTAKTAMATEKIAAAFDTVMAQIIGGGPRFARAAGSARFAISQGARRVQISLQVSGGSQEHQQIAANAGNAAVSQLIGQMGYGQAGF